MRQADGAGNASVGNEFRNSGPCLDVFAATYEGRCGGVLWATSAADGSRLVKYTVDVLPA